MLLLSYSLAPLRERYSQACAQAVEARLADDPWTRLKMLRVVSVERCEILLSARQ